MGIDITNPLPHQFIAFDKVQHLFMRGYRRLGQIVEQPEHIIPFAQVPTGQLTNYKRVRQYLSAVEQGNQIIVPARR